VLTGSKNAVKGLGFLLGAALLATFGFVWAVLGMAAVLAVILVAVLLAMPRACPRGRKGAKFSEVFSKSANVNWLSRRRGCSCSARATCGSSSASRSISTPCCRTGPRPGNRAAFFMIGTFMAVWIILYGAVQAIAPKLLRAASRGPRPRWSAPRGLGRALA
jgi:hypothetical protein